MASMHRKKRAASDEDSKLQEAKKLEIFLESPDEKDDDRLLESAENVIPAPVLEKLSEECILTMLKRLSNLKPSTLYPGLILACQQIVRFAATEGVNFNSKTLALLRRNSAIKTMAGVLRQLATAAGQLQNLHRIEDMMVAVVESLGWLSAKESVTAVETEHIREQAPEAGEAVAAAIEKFPKFLRLQVIGHGAMGWLKKQQEPAQPAEEGPAADPTTDNATWEKAAQFVLSGLKQDQDTEMQCLAVLAFGWLTFSSPTTGQELVKRDGAKSLVLAMQRHPLHRRLQYYACGTINWLVSNIQTGLNVAKVIANAGAGEATVAAMKLHPQDWGLQVGAFMTLASMVVSGKSPMLQHLMSLGAAETCCEAVERHPQARKVQLAGMICFQLFCQTPGAKDISHKQLVQHGLIELVVFTMQDAIGKEDKDLEVADAALEVLVHLVNEGKDPGTVTHILECKAIAIMLRRLSIFKFPAERANIERLQKFLVNLFTLNLGPVGWLMFDTEAIRKCLEEGVMEFLESTSGSLEPHLAHCTLRIIVPVVAGMVRQYRQKNPRAAIPPELAKFSHIMCSYAVVMPSLLQMDLKFLVDDPVLLSLDAKRAWLACERERLVTMGRNPRILIKTGRINIAQDLCETLAHEGAGETVSISIAFKGENAAGDGLRREWFQLVAKEFSDPNFNLFCSYDGGRTLQPSPTSSVHEGHTSYFNLCGKVVGLALLHGETMPMRFSSSFLKRILGHVLTPEDLQAVDPEAYKNIQYIVEADNVEDLCLTFAETSDHPSDVVMSEDTSGRMANFELVAGGSEKDVTDANKNEYIRLKVEHKLGLLRCRQQVEAFMAGLYEPIPRDTMMRLSRIVSVAELDLLIAGLPNIDIDDWEKHSVCMGKLKSGDPQVEWFWKILRTEFSQDELAKLLHFVTGSASVPASGFKNISGYNGRPSPFTLEGRSDQGPEHLPTAATCFNRLRMPVYENYEQMLLRLRTAISGDQQFHEAAMGNPQQGANTQQ